MTAQGPDGKINAEGRASRAGLGWLDQSVSWKLIIAALVVFGLVLALFVVAGGVSVSADKPAGWVERHFLHFVFKRSEASRAADVAPPADIAAESRVRLAAQHFEMVCANCHGRPGFGQSVIALSLNPRPQYLPKVVDQFTDSQLFEIVQHGVKYSGMPSWPTSARDDEVWSMVAFLRRLPKLDAATYLRMTAPPENVSGPSADPVGDPTLRPAYTDRESPPFDEYQYAAPAYGFSDESFHRNPAATCARCHGADGSGAVTGGEAPNLTIQNAAYLGAALRAYTTGARKSGFMQNIAAQLSDPQIAALSAYYAGLPVRTTPAPPADPALVKRGETIATQGVRERAIPACAECHESAGAEIIGAPHIAGQSDTFLRRQLAAMRRGGRGSSVGWNPMPAEAHQLGDNDIAAVAAYYSGLQPVKAAAGGQAAPPSAMLPGAAGLAEAKHIFETKCAKCHGADGRGDKAGGVPDLTLQSAPYVAQSLYAFRTRARPNEKMREIVDGLTFDQMSNLADYLNSLTPQRARLQQPDANAAGRGAAIAMHGAPARGVPACLNCHGAKGAAALPLIPRLQGQSVLYLRNKLNDFAKPYAVKNLDALNPMPSIAGQLTDQERADLAAYFAAAPPADKAVARP